MERTVRQSLIRQVPLFASLPGAEVDELVASLPVHHMAPGTVLFKEAERGDCLYILLTGQVEIVKALGTEDERLVGVRVAGEVVGEMSLLNPDGLRTASMRAQTEVEALELCRADFDALLRRYPLLGYDMARVLSRRLETSHNAAIHDLHEKNRQLTDANRRVTQAYEELKAAQAQIVEHEKLEHELELARKIQQSILPSELPALDGWQLHAFYQPARAVGGDFYDFLNLSDGRLGLVIGDASDKGVPAALVMATTRAVLRSTALHATAPGLLLQAVNEQLCADMPPKMFVTCLYAVLDPPTGRLQYANAGHDLPYRHSSGNVSQLHARGMPLGLMPDMEYEEKEMVVMPGERILFYSDGLVEAHNARGEMFGFAHLQAVMGQQPEGAPLVNFLLEQLASFTGPHWEQEDDLTLVTLERSEPA